MIVVKIGGSQGVSFETIAEDAAVLFREGKRLVLVHGGSALTNQVATQLGHPPEFVTSVSGFSSRRTDRRTLEIFTMVCAGQVNKSLVELLQKRKINAIGLSGMDGRRTVRRRAIAATTPDADPRAGAGVGIGRG
jgi:acetylglutamate/LysW-gamma-L-alpha-aminoadipate kinase